MAEGVVHVLVQLFMVRVEDQGLRLVHVHVEAIFGQQFLLLD